MMALILANLASNYSNATMLSNEDLSKIRQDAEGAAKRGLGNVGRIFTDELKSKNIQSLISENPDTIDQVPYSSTNLDNTPSLGVQQRERSDGECTKNSCNVGHAFSKDATSFRNSKMEEHTGIIRDLKTGEIIDNQGWLDHTRHKVKHAKDNIDFLVGNYTDCSQEEEKITSKSTEICDEFYDVQHNDCPAIQKVEIDPHYTYLCNKKREEKEKICQETIKKIECKKHSECDNGGIIASSVQSDMKWVYNFPLLTLGTIADNYWRGWCATFDRTTKFEVKNIEKITEFRIIEVGFDDYIWIKVNDNTVYVAPDGGDRIEVVRNAVTNDGKTRRGCERMTSWRRSVNIDLKPYLKEGENNIWMRVIVAGAGEGWMKISARQHCCESHNWVVSDRENKCEYY
ncbi:MAG: hypothetical protein HRU36_03095 [Rickettsiales bacterium]|nr:hypothetical protein [Rickettsiales bacterium]